MQTICSQPAGYAPTHGFFFGTNQGGPQQGPPPGPDDDSFDAPTGDVPADDEDGPVSPPPGEVQ
jgi:hypothetical protein